MSVTACLPTPSASREQYVLSGARQLSVAEPTSFVKRDGPKLKLDGEDFQVQGPNIYWLGLDENVGSGLSYPSKARVLEAMAIAKAMGATTVRSTSLGVSFGTGLSIENALNTFKPDSSAAWDAVDFALFAARSYGLRLVIPLTDQYDYYHGGIPTFLRWRNLPASNHEPFYDLNSVVYEDFRAYIRNLLTHVSVYTNLTMATDPTVLAFETGNELGGYSGKDYPPPVQWTTAISADLKQLAPQTLVVSGSYGIRKDELGIASIDIHSDHFYPTYQSRLSSSAKAAHSANKPFLVGEYDWTNQYYLRFRWGYFVLLLPAVLAMGVWFMPKRWWPWHVSLRNLVTCGGCCCGRKRPKRKRQRDATEYASMAEGGSTSLSLQTPPLESSSPSTSAPATPDLTSFESTASLPILVTPCRSETSRSRSRMKRIFNHQLRIDRWMFSLSLLLLTLPLFGIVRTYLPTPIDRFLSRLSSLEKTTIPTSSPSSVGDLYWSLFGRTDDGCHYVEHDDGYTLHYPSDPTRSSFSSHQSRASQGEGGGDAVVRLTKHAWRTRQVTPFWAASESFSSSTSSSYFDIDKLELQDLPVVTFPQEGLKLSNGTIVGGAIAI